MPLDFFLEVHARGTAIDAAMVELELMLELEVGIMTVLGSLVTVAFCGRHSTPTSSFIGLGEVERLSEDHGGLGGFHVVFPDALA